MQLSIDALEFIRLLNEEKIKYLIVGGWAVSFHYRPRYTKDIDIFIQPSDDNASLMLKVLDRFGFGSAGITAKDLVRPNYIIQLGTEPNRIDLLTGITGIDFELEWPRKVVFPFGGVDLNLISIEGLIVNKLATGRDQDLVDAKNLKKRIAKAE